MNKFWLVWSPQGNNPAHRHYTESDAERESRRLARLNPGKEFFVLQATKMSKYVEPIATIALADIEVPF